MTGLGPPGWQVAGFFLYLLGAIAAAIAAVWLTRKRGAPVPHRGPVLAALTATALWCVTTAALGPQHTLSALADVARNLAWLLALYRLFAVDGRDRSMAPVRPVALVLALVEGLQLALIAIGQSGANGPDTAVLVFEIVAIFRIMVAIGALVLLHNLYVGAGPSTREVLRWPAAALAGMWAYELNFFTVAYLDGSLTGLTALRGLLAGGFGLALVVGGSGVEEGRRFSPSRVVAFRTLSLAVIGGYLLLMAGLSYSLSVFGEELQRLTQVGFLFVAAVVALLWLPSRGLRDRWQQRLAKHLFQHRYDYRAEWLRFTRTMGQGQTRDEALTERAIRAMADVADSPSGLLLVPDDDDSGALTLAARWRWPSIEVPAAAIPAALAAKLERDGLVIDIDRARADTVVALPPWIAQAPSVWAIVPLLHFEQLQGVIMLSRPVVPRRLDWEDFDLLGVVGRQLASYLAEKSGQEALMEARQFDEFSRRIAFVMHDVKNLASQLSLLSRNAERHADNPEFRADMLVTLRNSADKLNALLARLGRYGGSGGTRREPVDLREMAMAMRNRLAAAERVAITAPSEVMAVADPDALERALQHLLQNAIEASEASQSVSLAVSTDGLRGRIEVIDSGPGMSADFVREGLFRPFVSSKPSGFGIGAFEARELVRAMGGRLDVESREGIGTRFAISLPLLAVQEYIRNTSAAVDDGAEVA